MTSVFNPEQVKGGAHRNPTPVTCQFRNDSTNRDRKGSFECLWSFKKSQELTLDDAVDLELELV